MPVQQVSKFEHLFNSYNLLGFYCNQINATDSANYFLFYWFKHLSLLSNLISDWLAFLITYFSKVCMGKLRPCCTD